MRDHVVPKVGPWARDSTYLEVPLPATPPQWAVRLPHLGKEPPILGGPHEGE